MDKIRQNSLSFLGHLFFIWLTVTITYSAVSTHLTHPVSIKITSDNSAEITPEQEIIKLPDGRIIKKPILFVRIMGTILKSVGGALLIMVCTTFGIALFVLWSDTNKKLTIKDRRRRPEPPRVQAPPQPRQPEPTTPESTPTPERERGGGRDRDQEQDSPMPVGYKIPGTPLQPNPALMRQRADTQIHRK